MTPAPSPGSPIPAGPSPSPGPRPLPAPRGQAGGRGDFVGRTLDGLGRKLRRVLVQERSARADGWLQSIDPRAKILGALALVVCATLLRHAALLVLLYALTLAAAATSKVDVRTTLKRVWLAVPLFTAALAAPAALNVITPGVPLFDVARMPAGAHLGPLVLPAVIAITRQGVDAALLIVARVATGVSVAVLLASTTRWQELLAASKSLGVPDAFVTVAEMTFRYFFLLAGLAEADFLARRSRTLATAGDAEARRFVAGRAGTLFRRSVALAGDVNSAMLARGWTGAPRVIGRRALRALDAVPAGGAAAICIVLLLVDRVAR